MAESGSPPETDGNMPRIVRTEGVLGGNPRIEGRRIGVYHVYQRYVSANESPEAIAESYDISLAEVHAALAFAFNNPEQMREIEAKREEIAEQTRNSRLIPDDDP